MQTAYQDNRIFPFAKKATSINIVVLVSKFFTIGVSFVNELDEPIPIIVLMGICFVNYSLNFLFPTKEELE